MMGVVCDANHKPLEYDHTADDFTINQGIIISKNKKAFDTAIERLVDNTGNDLTQVNDWVVEKLFGCL